MPRTHTLNLFATTLALLVAATPAAATLVWHYNPDNGNVAFDTADTKFGSIFGYQIGLTPDMGLQFRTENHIRLSQAAAYFTQDDLLADTTQAGPWEGLYTIGDVLPAGLDEPQARLALTTNVVYIDGIGDGGPEGYFPTDLSYGDPGRPFTNRWDLVNPNELTWAQDAKLIYQAWDGQVLLDTTGPLGGHIASFVLHSDHPSFDPDAYTPLPTSFQPPQVDERLVVWAEAIEPGVYSLGQIFETGLTAEQFSESLTEAKFVGRAGFRAGIFQDFDANGATLQAVWLPEPAAALGLVALATTLIRRRTNPTARASSAA